MHNRAKKEVIPIYGPQGEVLSEVTRNIKTQLVNIPTPKTSSEIIQKKPEFEDNTLHISTIGRDETTIRDYEGKVLLRMGINGNEKILEHKEDIAKGEQLFIGYETFVPEACKKKHCTPQELEEKYLPTEEKMTAIAGPQQKDKNAPASPEYKIFFETYIKPRKKPGYLIPRNEKLGQVGKNIYVRAAGGADIEFAENGRKLTKGGKENYGFSGRLFK